MYSNRCRGLAQEQNRWTEIRRGRAFLSCVNPAHYAQEDYGLASVAHLLEHGDTRRRRIAGFPGSLRLSATSCSAAFHVFGVDREDLRLLQAQVGRIGRLGRAPLGGLARCAPPCRRWMLNAEERKVPEPEPREISPAMRKIRHSDFLVDSSVIGVAAENRRLYERLAVQLNRMTRSPKYGKAWIPWTAFYEMIATPDPARRDVLGVILNLYRELGERVVLTGSLEETIRAEWADKPHFVWRSLGQLEQDLLACVRGDGAGTMVDEEGREESLPLAMAEPERYLATWTFALLFRIAQFAQTIPIADRARVHLGAMRDSSSRTRTTWPTRTSPRSARGVDS